MGLACAFEESLRGKSVAILDPNPPGHKASWAAAGILAARGGLMGSSALREFYLRSLYAYPEWLARIESESGASIPYERDGDYQIFSLEDAESRKALKSREQQLTRDKAANFSVSGELPPFLRAHSSLKKTRVFHFPGEAHVSSRVLLTALESALVKRGAKIFQKKPLSWSRIGKESLLAGEGWQVQARQVLIAAGAWCNDALGLLGLSAPMKPVKGQLAALPNFHGSKSMIHCAENLYLVPRGDQLIVGATTEPGVWEDDFNARGETVLRKNLQAFFPDAEPRWTETWAGLRPCTSDRLPLMGWVDEKAGIAISTGHYKSGISLAPLSARCLSALLNGEKPPQKLKAFDPLRKRGLRKTH